MAVNKSSLYDKILVFADGASSGNPGPGGWGAVIATPQGQVLELGGRESPTTNNRMELAATIGALNRLGALPGDVLVMTDSVYVIRGITQWIWGWRNKGWKTATGSDVLNADLWKALSGAVGARKKYGAVDWRWVRGHSGVAGNERADAIAVAFSQNRSPRLYHGPLLGYEHPIHDLPKEEPLPDMKDRAGPKPAAHSYLSLVNGVTMRHATWKECEARVKGRPGAKFKKAASESDEGAILASWGVKPGNVKAGS